jgi:hypothetical protein
VIGASPRERYVGANAEGSRHPDDDRRRHRTDPVEQAGHELRLQRAFCRGEHLLRTDVGGRRHEGCCGERGAGSRYSRPGIRRIDAGRLARTDPENSRRHADQMSSTAQDLARGKPSEIDFLNAHVVRKGAQLGIPTPTNHALQVMVKLAESRCSRTRTPQKSGSRRTTPRAWRSSTRFWNEPRWPAWDCGRRSPWPRRSDQPPCELRAVSLNLAERLFCWWLYFFPQRAAEYRRRDGRRPCRRISAQVREPDVVGPLRGVDRNGMCAVVVTTEHDDPGRSGLS